MPEFQRQYLKALATIESTVSDLSFEPRVFDAVDEMRKIEPTDGNIRSIEIALSDIESRRIIVDLVIAWGRKNAEASGVDWRRIAALSVEDLVDEILHAVGSGTRLLELRRRLRRERSL